MVSMNRIQRSGDNLANAIDWWLKNDAINRSKENPRGDLPTDIWTAGYFLGDKIKTDTCAVGLLNPFVETYMKESEDHEYNHQNLMDTLAYSRTLMVLEDVNSDVFKKIHKKKKEKLKEEKISDEDAKKEIVEILNKKISTKEIQKNKNLQNYLMQCRKSLIWYSADPEERTKNKEIKDKFNKKISKYSIEDMTFNKLSLMIMRDYFEAFFADKKEQLGWDNFKVKIANNYDNLMWWSHLIVWFKDEKNPEGKHFVLHINTQWAHKKMPQEIIPYDFSNSLKNNGKSKPIMMTMKDLSWGNKELLYKFIWNAVETIKEKWVLDHKDVKAAFNSAWPDQSIEHVKTKIIELLTEDPSLAA